MPSHRRGRSRSRERSRSRSRGRSESSERVVRLPNDAKPISESDYFLRSDEFKVWLKDEKDKYLDELSSDRSHRNIIESLEGTPCLFRHLERQSPYPANPRYLHGGL
ncbi:hypothetical protein BDW22DRAFT_31178 [Trametopsis cervina]|nr:hypothetical protein BDW22DRAFT_31178 [Trametopsis cervina]